MIAITVDSRRATDMLHRLERSIPQATKAGIRSVAQRGARNMKQSARDNITNPGTIPKSITAKKLGEYSWGVTLSKKGFWRDSAEAGYVPVTRFSRINSWLRKVGYPTYTRSGKSKIDMTKKGFKGWLYVMPDPFVRVAYEKTVAEAKSDVEKEINRTMKTKGR